MKKLTIVLLLIIVLVGCTAAPTSENLNTTTTKFTTTTEKPTTTTKGKLTYGDTVKVDNFEFAVIKTEIKEIDNQFSDIKEAVAIHVAIKNTGDKTEDIAFIQHPVFSPDGDEVESLKVSIYFDDAIDVMAKIRSGNTLEGIIYCEYVGDGEYIMEVSSLFGDTYEIYFEVNK